jgi:hypothetical protein
MLRHIPVLEERAEWDGQIAAPSLPFVDLSAEHSESAHLTILICSGSVSTIWAFPLSSTKEPESQFAEFQDDPILVFSLY